MSAVVIGLATLTAGESATIGKNRAVDPNPKDGIPVVPRVIGDSWIAASKELGHRRLQTRLAFLGNQLKGRPCPGGRDQGVVVLQKPAPGTRLTLHQDVRIQIGCPSLSDLEQCPRSELFLTDFGVDAIGVGAPNTLYAGIKHVYGRACRLRGMFRLSLRHNDGTLASEIRGNPSTVPIDHRLGVGETLNLSWGWSGCPRGKFFATLSGPDGLDGRTNAPPYCQEGRIPNRLYASDPPSHGENGNRAYKTALRALRP